MRQIPNEDLVEISLIAWPADAASGPRLLGRLRDTDLVREALERLAAWDEFDRDYLAGAEAEAEPKAAAR